MSLDYEKKKYKIIKEMVDNYKQELLEHREIALDMPIETDNGFNVERERLITDIDEKLDILKRHAGEPYFAKLIFKDVDDGEDFQGYIGRLSIGEINDSSDNKVVDWRAPISDLYYNGRIGKTSYNANGSTYNVDLQLKRQIEIKNNDVQSIFDFQDTISNDEFLKPYLTQSADNRLKNIVATIQEEQDKIIRLPIFKNLVVQGVAGSGKTTVALHRISYLMYNYKNQVKPEEFLIISPNEIFMSYISSILKDLDADKSNSFSLNKMAEDVIGTGYTLMNKHEQYNNLLKNNQSIDYLKYKGSKEFVKVLDDFLEYYLKEITSKDLVVEGVKILDGEVVNKYFSIDNIKTMESNIEHCCRKLALALQYDESLKSLAKINIEKIDVPLVKKFKILRILDSGNVSYIKKSLKIKLDVIEIYKNFILNIYKFSQFENILQLQQCTLKNLKNKKISHDDLACIFYLLFKIFETPYYNKMKCVLIDEAQDLSELMFIALKGVFCNATFGIFGDIAQGIYAYQSIDNWQNVTRVLDNCELLYLQRSYRTSIEIMEEANKTLKTLGYEPANNVVRHGDKVDIISNVSVEKLKDILKELNKKYKTTAILCKNDNELENAIDELNELELIVIDENNTSYDSYQNVLLTVQTAKGLEFDSVIVYNESAYTEDVVDQRLLYVAKTRALHKLVICK